jgi:hypothetical protein
LKCAWKDSNFQPADFKSAASYRIGLHALVKKLLAAGFEPAHRKFLKLSPLPFGLREQGNLRFSICELRLIRDFLSIANRQPQIANKMGVEDGIFTRTSHVLTKPHPLCASLPFPPLRREKNIKYRRRESNSQITVSKTAAFAVWLRRRKKLQISNSRFQINLEFEIWNLELNLVWAAGFEPANTCFQNKPV